MTRPFSPATLSSTTFVLTANFQLYFFRPIKSGSITAQGVVVSQPSRILTAEAVAFDDDGKEIARGSGQFMKTKIQLKSFDAYTNNQ